MFYNIGSVSNRDIQLLYQYRILREPSENLSAIVRASEPVLINQLDWSPSTKSIEGYDTVYEVILSDFSGDYVPFLEFHPTATDDWRWIADFIGIETDDQIIMYSASSHLASLPISIYKCYSLRHITAMLNDILEKDIPKLIQQYEQLMKELSTIKKQVSTQLHPEGLEPNLVRIRNTGTELGLVDSQYQISTAESNRLFVNYSQDNLNHMDHIINESVEFRFLDKNHYVLESFITPSMLVSGFGDLVLRNIKGQILITKWLGTVTVIDCPDVHIVADTSADICRLDYLLISRGSVVYLENQIHIIKKMKLTADSICRHWRANVNRLDYVGPGCTYWCSAQVSVPGRVQLTEYTDFSNTVFDFNMSDIIGAFVSDFDNILIVSQKNLTPRLGNSDTEPEPSVYVSEFHMKY